MNLAPFKNPGNLHQTTLDFFTKTLNIKINVFDAKPFTKEDFFKDKEKVKTAAVKKIENIYVIGLVDDDSLAEKTQKISSIEDAENIGEDYPGLMVCALPMKSTPKRSELATLTRLVNRSFPNLPVTIVFQYDDKITFANAERTQYLQAWREGEKIGKISMLKDINVENPHGAHLKILRNLKVSDKISDFKALYEHWQEVLNTKELNKEFFKKIANWYFWSVAKSKFPFEYLKAEEKYKDKTDKELQELANQKATIRFITRIIFVWFLKEKKLIPDFLFEEDEISKLLKKDKNNSNYFNAILQNLFFATLNRAKETRDFALNEGYLKNKDQFDVNSLYRYENLFADENPKNIMQIFKAIPFLNGGLFDSLDKKATKKEIEEGAKTEIIDGFSRETKWQAKMPNQLFFETKNVDFNKELNEIYQSKTGKYELKGLFEIFGEYKFTIEENTPLEVDVALDPYLLGEIFENLLAYYNPETGATARKGSGSFYTPQEIVNYMVDQSLLAYLKTQLPEMKWDNFEVLETLNKKDARNVVEKLCNIKILDPACGSGAFPMGVLYKMVSIFNTIDVDNSLLKQVQHDKIIGNKIAELEADKKAIENLNDKQVREKATAEANERLQELETIFDKEHNYDDYARKLFMIQNCIYGVDIQDVAIQISKLRFFLSLIIDQKNDNIQPLPNLETKFVIANTLIGIELPKLQFLGEDDHSEDHTKELKEQLKAVRQKHFNATTRTEKNKIKKEDQKIRLQIADSLAKTVEDRNLYQIEGFLERIENLKTEILKAEKLPETGEIVAGDLFETKIIKTFPRKEKIAELNNSIKSFEREIERKQNTNAPKIIREQAKKIAQWDIYNQNAQADWFDMDWMFGVQDGFDVVIGNPPYVQLQKDGGKLAKLYENCGYETFAKKGDIYALFYENGVKQLKQNGVLNFITSNKWMRAGYGESLRQFLAKNNPLSLIDLGSGIFENATVDTNILLVQKTQNAEKTNSCIVKKDVLKELENFIKENSSVNKFTTAESWVILSPIEQSIKEKIERIGTPLKDWDINIYRGVLTGFNEAFIINGAKRKELIEADPKSDEIIRPILRGRDIKKYSYDFADLWLINTHNGIKEKGIKPVNVKDYPAIKKHLDQYLTQLKKRQDKGDTPYNLRNCAYIEDFSKQKIVWKAIGRNLAFSILEENKFLTAPASFITSEYNLYLLGFLCSSFAKFYIYKNSDTTGAGDIMLNIQSLENIPIPKINDSTKVEEITCKIIKCKKSKSNSDELERTLDNIIYKLFSLNKVEIKFIENL